MQPDEIDEPSDDELVELEGFMESEETEAEPEEELTPEQRKAKKLVDSYFEDTPDTSVDDARDFFSARQGIAPAIRDEITNLLDEMEANPPVAEEEEEEQEEDNQFTTHDLSEARKLIGLFSGEGFSKEDTIKKLAKEDPGMADVVAYVFKSEDPNELARTRESIRKGGLQLVIKNEGDEFSAEYGAPTERMRIDPTEE